MQKKYFLKTLIAGLAGILVLACHKDNQQYKYRDINNLTIEETNESSRFTVSVNDSLIIIPNLRESDPVGDEIIHEWRMDDSLVSTNEHLRILVDQEVGSHTVFYKATNTNTGVQALQQYYVTVRGTYYSGYYIAHNKNGKAEFSFLRADKVLFANPFEQVNQKSYGGKALSLVYSIESPTASSGTGSVVAWTSDNAWRFDGNSLKEIHDVSTWFPAFTDFPLTQKGDIFAGLVDQVLIFEGGIHGGSGSLFGSVNTSSFSSRYPGDYDVFPAIFPLRYLTTTYFYDNNHKRFLAMAGQQRSVTVAPATTGAFNMADVGLTMIDSDGTGDNGNTEFYYLMGDGNARWLLHNYNTAFLGQGVPSVGIKQQMLNSPDIERATIISASATLKHIYYAADNKVYLYDILSNSARLLYTFPAGYSVKEMKRALPDAESPYLAVAIDNGTAGEIYFFNLEGDGSFTDDTFSEKFEGFGEIVSMSSTSRI